MTAGISAWAYAGIAEAVAGMSEGPPGRVLICGSLYLAGRVLMENT